MIRNKLAAISLLLLATACGPESTPSQTEEERSTVTISTESGNKAGPLPSAIEQPALLILGSTFSVARGLPPEQGYAALLQQRLVAEQASYTILNASVAEETAAGATERLRYLLVHPPNQVVLELGQADEARQTPPRAFARDVKKLLRHIRSQHPDIPILMLASTPSPPYYDALEDAAETVKGVRLSPLLLENGNAIHSDDPGRHRQLAEKLWPVLNQGMKE